MPSAYRYGMNGMEKDDEVTGVEGSSYTATFWQYDSRLGRRWNVDPVPFAGISSYATFANNPIIFSDPNGDCATCPKDGKTGDTHEWAGETFTRGEDGGWSANLEDFVVGSNGVNSSSSNPSISNNNSTGVTYSASDLRIRDNIRSLSINNPLRRGLEANEGNGVYLSLYDGSRPYKGFNTEFDKGYAGLTQSTKDLFNIAAVAVAIPLLSTTAAPILIEASLSGAIEVHALSSTAYLNASTYAYVQGSYLLSQSAGYVGGAYFYTGVKFFGPRFAKFGSNPGMSNMDKGHFYSRLLYDKGIGSFPSVKNFNTIFINNSGVVGSKPGFISYGINPWTRTIFHAAPGKFK